MLRRFYGILLPLLVAGFFPISSTNANAPADRRVTSYQQLNRELTDKYTREAISKKEFVEEEENLKRLDEPFSQNQNVKIRWWSRGRWQEVEGRLYNVLQTRATIGGRTVVERDVDPIDWVRIQMSDKPNELRDYVAGRRKRLEQNRSTWITQNVAGDLERQYHYSEEFWKNSVEVAGSYWLRSELGDNTVEVSVTVPFGVDHHEEFVEFTMSYRGGTPMAALLEFRTIPPALRRQRREAGDAAEDVVAADAKWIPIGAVYEPDARRLVRDAKWRIRTFRVLLKDLADTPQELFRNFPQHTRVTILKEDVGHWELIPAASRTGRTQRLQATCPECWGEKFTEADPEFKAAVDAADDPLLKRILEAGSEGVGQPGREPGAGSGHGAAVGRPGSPGTSSVQPPPEDEFLDFVDGPIEPGDTMEVETKPEASKVEVPRVAAPVFERRADGKVTCRSCSGSGLVHTRHSVATLTVSYKLVEKSVKSYELAHVRNFRDMAQQPDFTEAATQRMQEIAESVRTNRIAELRGEATAEREKITQRLQQLRGEKLTEMIDTRHNWYGITEMRSPRQDDDGARIDMKDWIPANGVLINDAIAPTRILDFEVERFSPWIFCEGLLIRERNVYEILKVHYRVLQCKPVRNQQEPVFVLQYAVFCFGGNQPLSITPTLVLPVSENPALPLTAAEDEITISQTFSTKARWLGSLIGAKEISLSQALGTIDPRKVKLTCTYKAE